MKMSDYFELPIGCGDIMRINEYCTVQKNNDGVAPFDAAEHAINNHDRLVEENATLTRERDFLAETIDQLSDHVSEAELEASSISVKFDRLTEENAKLREILEMVIFEAERNFDNSIDTESLKSELNQLKDKTNDK